MGEAPIQTGTATFYLDDKPVTFATNVQIWESDLKLIEKTTIEKIDLKPIDEKSFQAQLTAEICNPDEVNAWVRRMHKQISGRRHYALKTMSAAKKKAIRKLEKKIKNDRFKKRR